MHNIFSSKPEVVFLNETSKGKGKRHRKIRTKKQQQRKDKNKFVFLSFPILQVEFSSDSSQLVSSNVNKSHVTETGNAKIDNVHATRMLKTLHRNLVAKSPDL